LVHPLLRTVDLERYAEKRKELEARYDRELSHEEWEKAGDGEVFSFWEIESC
jgi:hypothetical protein